MFLPDKIGEKGNMNTYYLIALIMGIIMGVLSINPKFLGPYVLGFAIALVAVTLLRWLM